MERAFDRRSLALLAVIALVGAIVGFVWREHVSLSVRDADPLLWACWVGMLGLAMIRVRFSRDVPLAVVALLGGALIETWGTRSGLWTYFTGEEPPLFILPAWPVAALATERVSWRLRARFDALPDRAASALYATATALFAIALVLWARRAIGHPLTLVALGCVAIVVVVKPRPKRDLARFLAGCLVGFPLELWGTTHGCWTYWDGRTPPLVAVLSHGFATVAFARGVTLFVRRAESKDVAARAREIAAHDRRSLES